MSNWKPGESQRPSKSERMNKMSPLGAGTDGAFVSLTRAR
jgi:hypothetical protein